MSTSVVTDAPPLAGLPRISNESLASQKRPRDKAAVAMAADMQTITQITHIQSDRLRLVSVYASFFTSIDSVLFSVASSNDGRTPTDRLMLACLVGALIFHAAAAILAYVASFVLIRHKLSSAQLATNSSESPITTVYAKYAPPRSTSVDKRHTPSALESGNSSSRDEVENIHNPHAFASPFTTPLLAGWPPFLSTLTTVLTSVLDEPPLLKIDLRRVSLFDHWMLASCVSTPVHDDDPRAEEEKNAKALLHLLHRCHIVCTVFALSGFLLVITGITAYLWAVLERTVAIFGSACVGTCIVLGLAALR